MRLVMDEVEQHPVDRVNLSGRFGRLFGNQTREIVVAQPAQRVERVSPDSIEAVGEIRKRPPLDLRQSQPDWQSLFPTIVLSPCSTEDVLEYPRPLNGSDVQQLSS